jgi:hypothetical protein
MDICFECIFEGKRLYRVVRSAGSETSLFTGTAHQCKRFIEVYQEKVMKARFRDRRSQRDLQVSN